MNTEGERKREKRRDKDGMGRADNIEPRIIQRKPGVTLRENGQVVKSVVNTNVQMCSREKYRDK